MNQLSIDISLASDITQLIKNAKQSVAVEVNA